MTDSEQAQAQRVDKDSGRGECFVFETLFDSADLQAAIEILPDDIRKIRFTLDDTTPEPILRLAATVSESVEVITRFNTAILKRYRAGELSRAYESHQDPEEFIQEPLAFITLAGTADLTVECSVGPKVITCSEGNLVVIDPELDHEVTPPLNESGERYFLFLGFSSEV